MRVVCAADVLDRVLEKHVSVILECVLLGRPFLIP